MKAYSLMDSAGQPVFEPAAGWIMAAVSGTLATALCMIGVALFGYLLLAGRLSMRKGAACLLGAFMLLGAPLLANSLMDFAPHTADGIDITAVQSTPVPRHSPLPMAEDSNPYARVSAKRRR